MARNDHRMSRTCLAASLSVLLALGGVPAPALAEAVSEPATSDEPAAVEPASPDDSDFSEGTTTPAPDAAPAEDPAPASDEQPAPAEPAPALTAQATYSGTWGTCQWEISQTGTLTVRPGEGESQDGRFESPWVSYNNSINQIVFVKSGTSRVKLPKESQYLFCELSNVSSIDLSGADSSAVTDMFCMFYDCSSLMTLKVPDLVTSKVTDLTQLFEGCESLESVEGLASWDTSSVTSMFSLFGGCSSLDSLDLSGWDTSSVEDAEGMFDGCSPASIQVGAKYKMQDATMFPLQKPGYRWCSAATGASYKSAAIVETRSGLADTYMQAKLASIAYGTWGTCPWEIYLDGTLVVWPGEGESQEGKESSPWAAYSDNITAVEFGWSDDSWVKLPADSHSLFEGLSNVVEMDLFGADTSEVTNMGAMFYDCFALASVGGLSDWDTSNVTDMHCMFEACYAFTSLDDISCWDTSSVTDMCRMFLACSSLTSLDVTDWETPCVEDMSEMFSGVMLASVGDLSEWDTSNVTDMHCMFQWCNNLTSVGDISEWKTANVTDMAGMFYGCSSLTSLDVSGWDVRNVRDMGQMFGYCAKLASVDLSSWKTPSLQSVFQMFYGCSSPTSLDLTGLNTSKVVDAAEMFSGCSSVTIKVSADYAMTDAAMFPEPKDYHLWRSQATGRNYTGAQIVATRSGIADTYTQVENRIDISGATVAPIKGRGYDGTPYEPEPKVTLGGKTLVKDKDYTLSYRNNVYASNGKPATVTITGIGGYKGKKEASFQVWKNGQPMDAWAVARQAPAASLKSRDVTVEAPIHVAHAVSAAKPMEFRKVGGDTKLNVDIATGRVTVRKGTKAGTYKVKIRVIAFGGANYADGSKTVECSVRVVSGKLDQDFQLTATDVTRTAASLASADYLTRPFKVDMAVGRVTYRKHYGSDCLDVDSAGRLRVRRGTAPGWYFVQMTAIAAGDAGYRPCERGAMVSVVVK